MAQRLDLHLFKVYGSCELGVKSVQFIKLTVGFNERSVILRNESAVVLLLRGSLNNCLEATALKSFGLPFSRLRDILLQENQSCQHSASCAR